MTVSQLIEALQAVPNQSALVTVDSTIGVNLDSVDVAGATNATFEPDAPDAESGDTDPGVVDLVGAA